MQLREALIVQSPSLALQRAAMDEIARLDKLVVHKQHIIDKLMLEYCPNDMTAEQLEEYARHQKPVNRKDSNV